MTPILAIRDLTKRYGGLLAVDGFSLDLAAGEVHALIGPNGAGKTTLVGMIAGEVAATAGTVHFSGRDISRLGPPERARRGLARSFQITSIFPDFTALENVALAVQGLAGHSFRFWAATRGDPTLIEPARRALDEVGLGARAEAPAADLSHGEHRALEIAMAIVNQPKVILLDEPTAGMGVEESAAMARLLHRLRERSTLLLVEHDMDVVFALADRITVLVYGRAIASGTPDQIRANPAVREAYLGDEHAGGRQAPC